jgi:predicted porin
MKKTILAMAVPALLAAGAVNAATVYDQDGVTVTIGGAAEVQLIQNYEGKMAAFGGDDKNLDVRLDDGELNFGVEVAVSDSLTALGYYDFEYEGGSVKNDELYAGLKGDFGTFTAGRQYTIWDDSGIGEDIELGLEGVDDKIQADGDNVLKYRYEGDAFWFALAHDLDAWNDDAEANEENQHTDAGLGTSVAGIDLAAYFSTGEDASNNDSDAWQLSAVYNVEAFTVGASYTDFELDNDKANSGWVTETLFGYAMGDFQYYLGYNFGENDDDSKANNIYANATYKMHSNVKTYVELGFVDIEDAAGNSEDSTGFLVGMEVKF